MPRRDSRRPAAPSATGGRASSFHEDDLHRLFVPPEQIAELVRLGPAQSHHLAVVLRLGPGAELEIFDVRGARWPARIEAPGAVRLGRRAGTDRGAVGGWVAQGRAEAAAAGFASVTLGPRVLRTETAGLAALAIVQHLAGDLG